MKDIFDYDNYLPKLWVEYLKILDIAFQPIINIHTAEIYGVEALLRNYQEIGFESIFALFDRVHAEGFLYIFDLHLREKAFKKFTSVKNHEDIKLFYNLDNRLFDMTNFTYGNTSKILKKLGIKKTNICFEISERHQVSGNSNLERTLQHYKENNYDIAIDDFGVGYSGYKLLYDSTPDIIKIDRFFLQGIENNIKKRLLVRNITHLAGQLGIKVIAEGVETKAELYTCREIGCHFVQGYLIQRPTQNTSEILPNYPHILKLINHQKRFNDTISRVEKHIKKLKPIQIKNKMSIIIEHFKQHKQNEIIPIVNRMNEPEGIIHESQIKEVLYSPFGISLLHNEESEKSKIKNFLKPCPNTDLNSDISTIIELFSNDPESIGIMITKNSKYYGFLSSRAIISIMNEENLLQARDQNPLTKLPGNSLIEKYISNVVLNENSYILCYFDLDNFKAFNDIYGFRNGDRIIQLFADLIRKILPHESFKAHIGGDDFFVAITDKETEGLWRNIDYLREIITQFSSAAREFYSEEDKQNGYIHSKDREGNDKIFPLLSVSASVLVIRNNSVKKTSENIHKILSLQKKVAKGEINKMALSILI